MSFKRTVHFAQKLGLLRRSLYSKFQITPSNQNTNLYNKCVKIFSSVTQICAATRKSIHTFCTGLRLEENENPNTF